MLVAVIYDSAILCQWPYNRARSKIAFSCKKGG
jgi:hypothetical protein